MRKEPRLFFNCTEPVYEIAQILEIPLVVGETLAHANVIDRVHFHVSVGLQREFRLEIEYIIHLTVLGHLRLGDLFSFRCNQRAQMIGGDVQFTGFAHILLAPMFTWRSTESTTAMLASGTVPGQTSVNQFAIFIVQVLVAILATGLIVLLLLMSLQQFYVHCYIATRITCSLRCSAHYIRFVGVVTIHAENVASSLPVAVVGAQ